MRFFRKIIILPLCVAILIILPQNKEAIIKDSAPKPACKKNTIKAKIKDRGLARGESPFESPDPLSPTGTDSGFSNIRVVDRTDRIPLQDGSIIHVTFEVFDLPVMEESINGFYILVTFPEIKNPKNRSFSNYRRQMSVYKAKGDDKSEIIFYWSFSDRNPYEMVEGTWTFSLFYKDCLIAQQIFWTFIP